MTDNIIISDINVYLNNINEYLNNKTLRDMHIYKLFTEFSIYEGYIKGYNKYKNRYKYENISDDYYKLLIDAGADVNQINENGVSLLMCAIERDDITQNTIKMLIDAGADINHIDNNGNNALMYIKYTNNVDNTIKMLIDAGIDVNKTDNIGINALMRVFNWKFCDYKHTLYGCAHTLFYNAVNIFNNAVKLLIDAGININHIDKNGNNVLICMMRNYCLNKIIYLDLLVKAGIDVNIVMDNGVAYSVLYSAVKNGDIELVQYLNSNGLITPNMIEFIDIKGETLMNWAVRCKKITIVKIIVGCGADIRKRNSKGESPIDIARNRNYNVIVKYLTERGAI